MTTQVTIHNKAVSNGDVTIQGFSMCEGKMNAVLLPGQKRDLWITDQTMLHVGETWPTSGDGPNNHSIAGEMADEMIAAEVTKQDTMWGIANERADSAKGQLMQAGMAQLEGLARRVFTKEPGPTDGAFNTVPAIYPSDWTGFRDYGSNVANLVVAVAFLRQEIKRRIALGESTERAARRPDQQYAANTTPATA